MTPDDARKVIRAAKRRGALFSARAKINDDDVQVTMASPKGDTATIKMAFALEGATPEHFRELIDWQMEAWQMETYNAAHSLSDH